MRLFVGKTCIPCKKLKEWLATEGIEVPQVVVDDNMDEAEELGIKSLPTLVLDDGTLVKGSENIMTYFKGGNGDE